MGEATMLVNVVEEEEARIAIIEDGRLGELFVERTSRDRIVGNVYKGRVVNVTPSIEAAFVEFGYRKHGFLHVTDVRASAVGAGGAGRGREKDITKLVKKGDEVLVQVTKEGIGDKGPALTTYLSLPGRYVVLMPGMSLRGVSRRISDDVERRRLKDLMAGLEIPQDIGIIARTASLGAARREIERDINYLVRLWQTIKRRADKTRPPAIVYQESEHVIRVIRDVFHDDIRRVMVDSREMHQRVRDFLRETMPHHVRKVKLYDGHDPIFHHYGVEQEIANMHRRSVSLPCGGGIVVDQTEALVAIDVNSGQFKAERDPEESAFKINIEAAEEITRQIRLRDLGGLVLIDFIDMQDHEHRAEVEKALWKALKRDKARLRMLKMSAFCIVEMTRQRRRASMRQAGYVQCPTCRGTAHVKSTGTLGLDLVRALKLALHSDRIARVRIETPPAVANFLNNAMRSRIEELAEQSGKEIVIDADPSLGHDEHKMVFLNQDGASVSLS